MLPIMLIWIGLPFKELQMKERKAVDQLALSIALALSEGRELADEPALLQFLKITLAIAAGRNPRRLKEFLLRHSALALGKFADKSQMRPFTRL